MSTKFYTTRQALHPRDEESAAMASVTLPAVDTREAAVAQLANHVVGNWVTYGQSTADEAITILRALLTGGEQHGSNPAMTMYVWASVVWTIAER
jgi:hypothetical protein